MKPKSHFLRLRSSNALVSLITTVTVCFGTASMATAAWEGGISSAWSDAGNWNPAGVPVDPNVAVVNTTPANIATISSAVPNAGALQVGVGGSTNGTLNVVPLGSIRFTKTGADSTTVGAGSTGKGTLNISGGTLTSVGEFWAGNQAGSQGFLNISGGTMNVQNWVAIGRIGGVGRLEMTGGTLNQSAAGNFSIAQDVNSKGSVIHSGGSITATGQFFISNGTGAEAQYDLSGTGTVTANSWFVVGRSAGKGTLNMTGGTIVKNTVGTSFIVGGNNAADVGIMNQSGGLVNVSAGDTWIAELGTGTITLTGGEFRANYFQVARGGGSKGNAFLNAGGTLSVRQIAGGAGTENLHFNGTQVIARENQAAFINNNFDAGSVKIDAGGFKIDSNGFNIGTAQELTGVGGIVKSGSGTFRLNGVQSFSGGIQVNGGKLLRGSEIGTLAGTVTVAAGAGFGPAVIDNTDQAIITNLSQASGSSLDVDLGNAFGNPTAAVLDVTGTVNFAGPVTINLNDQLPSVGPIKLMRFVKASATGVTEANIVPGTLPPGVRLNALTPFKVDTTSDATYGFIIANVTYASQAVWIGGVNDQWNLTTPNWYELNTEIGSSKFTQGASTLFDDTADAYDVVLGSGVDVKPDLVTFNNSSAPYTLTGSGRISDSTGTPVKTSLVKRGGGSLTLATPNTFTGPSTFFGGITSVPTLANGGAASPLGGSTADRSNLILSGGSLSYTGAAAVIDRGFTIAANDSTLSVDNSLELKGGVNTTGGNFIKKGPGNLILSNDSTNTLGLVNPGVRVTEGTLTLKGAGAQTNTVTGEMWIANTPDVSANLVLDTTTLTTTNFLAIGRGNGSTGTICNLTASNSTMNTVNFSSGYNNGLANNQSTQNLDLTATTWTNNGVIYLAESPGATSVAVFDAVTYTGTAAVVLGRLGPSAAAPVNPLTSNGSLTLKNGSQMTKSAGLTLIGENGTGFLELQDSSTYTSAAGEMYVGSNDIGRGTVNIKGTSTLSVLGDNALRVGNTGKGVLNQSGGTVNVGGWAIIGRYANTDPAVVSELNISGGSFNQTDAARLMIIGEQGKGIVNLTNSGEINAAGSILVSNGPTGAGTFNIGAGTTVTTQAIIKGGGNGGGGTSAVYFDGGLVKVQSAATAATFMTGLDIAQVKAGGLKLDTNGKDIVINQFIGNDGSSGTFTKSGAGRLTMNGSINLIGDATISAGGLSGTGPFNVPTLKIAAGADVNPGPAGGQGTLTAGINMSFAAGSSLTIDVAATSDLLSVFDGTLDLGGATLNVTGGGGQAVYVIAEYNTLTGTFAGGANPPGLPSGYTIDYAYNGGTQIALIQTATPYSVWANANITAIQPGADASPGGNPDNDGLTNSAEFGLNSNPLSGASSGLVISKVANIGAVPSLILSLPVRSGAVFSGSPATTSALVDGLTYKIEGSAALTAWNLPVTEVTGADKTAIENGMPVPDAGWTRRTFTTGAVSAAPKAFIRTVIGQP